MSQTLNSVNSRAEIFLDVTSLLLLAALSLRIPLEEAFDKIHISSHMTLSLQVQMTALLPSQQANLGRKLNIIQYLLQNTIAARPFPMSDKANELIQKGLSLDKAWQVADASEREVILVAFPMFSSIAPHEVIDLPPEFDFSFGRPNS